MRPRSPTLILLSIACAIFICGFGLLFWQLNRVTPTTELIGNPLLQKIDLQPAPGSVLKMPAGTGSSGLIRKAIDQFLLVPDLYSKANADATNLPAIDSLLRGLAGGESQIFSDHPAEIINFDREKKKLEAVSQIGRFLAASGLLALSNDVAKGEKLFDAEFELGARLYEERLCFAELSTGMALMAEAIEGLERVSIQKKDSARADQIQSFRRACRTATESILPIEAAVSAIDPAVIDAHAGDVVAIASNAQVQRMWRVEGILATARLRFSAARKGDQRRGEKLLESLTNDPDLIIQTAARSAKALSVEQYRAQ